MGKDVKGMEELESGERMPRGGKSREGRERNGDGKGVEGIRRNEKGRGRDRIGRVWKGQKDVAGRERDCKSGE